MAGLLHMACVERASCFTSSRGQPAQRSRLVQCRAARDQQCERREVAADSSRRHLLAGGVLLLPLLASREAGAVIKGYEPMPALQGKDYGKPRFEYSDYVQTPSGLQYQDIVEGTGPQPREGQTVVVDWAGVTIGYYGRPFEARNKPKGGAFTGDEKDFFRFKLGAHTVIPAFEEAVAGMKVGGIRRLVVPVELGYPNNDFNQLGPAPTTFSGRRALDFVLKNQGLIDKTLLYDVELIKVLD